MPFSPRNEPLKNTTDNIITNLRKIILILRITKGVARSFAELLFTVILLPQLLGTVLCCRKWLCGSLTRNWALSVVWLCIRNIAPLGLGSKLVCETLFLVGTPYVEIPAVMAKYNPFAERAGMRKIAEQPPPKEALAIAETLRKLGFNIHLLASEKYVLNKLKSLSEKEIQTIKEAFVKNCHARFTKYFFCHMPFGRKEEYAKSNESKPRKALPPN